MAFSSFNSFHSTKTRIFKKITSTTTLVNSYATPLSSPFTGFSKIVTGNTGNTAYQNGTYFITESSEYGAGYSAWKAFNDDQGIFNYATASGNFNASGSYNASTSTILSNSATVLGEWIQIHYPYSFILNNYVFAVSGDNSSAVNSWSIVGSNDGSSWVTLDTKTLITPPGGTGPVKTQFVTSVTNTVAYSYYRFIITHIVGGNGFGTLSSINYFVPSAIIPLTTYFTPTSAPFTSTNLTIAGDTNTKKNGLYVASSSSDQPNSNLISWNAFNASIIDSLWISASNTYSSVNGAQLLNTLTTINGSPYYGEWLQIKLPSAIVLSSYELLPRCASAATCEPRTWYVAGSNDNITWNLLDSQNDPQTANNSYWTTSRIYKNPKTFPVSTSLTYSYYRFIINAAYGSNGQNYSGINQFNLIGI
jgi:hypothetical protein